MLLPFVACAVAPPRSTSVLVSGTAPPVMSGELPVGPSLVVEPLVSGQPTPLTVSDAPGGAEVTVWRGTFGGTSCPAALATCLPIGLAEAVATGPADALGLYVGSWTVPLTDAIGSYVVFLATVEETRSLHVMRRVWDGGPDLMSDDALDLWDEPGAGWTAYESVPLLPPGDWMDLALDGAGDAFAFHARGNELVMAAATFHAGFIDVLPGFVQWPGDERALESIYWDWDWYVDRNTLLLEGRSLVTGEWHMAIEADYGDHQGLYDLRIRLTPPDETRPWYADADADGYGDPTVSVEATVAPDGTSWNPEDCDDADPAWNPAAWDVCEDGDDDDCSGTDKRCHGAPDADGPLLAYSALHADLGPYAYVDPFAVGDADGDGVPEVWARDDQELWVLEAPPGGSVVLAEVVDAPDLHGGVAVADLDHDGTRDLAYGGFDAEPGGLVLITALPTDPAALEGAAWATLIGSPGTDLGLELGADGDVDGDAFADLLIRSEDAAWLVTSVPAGTTLVTDAATASFSGAELGTAPAVTADLDADGLADLAFDGPSTGVVYAPFAGAVDLSSPDATITFVGNDATLFSTGDVDGDGVAELLVGAYLPTIACLFESPRGPQDPAFAASSITLSASGGRRLLDLDGDGFDDLVTSGAPLYGDHTVEILYGPLPAVATVPDDSDVTLTGSDLSVGADGLWTGDYDLDGGDDLAVGSIGPGAPWHSHYVDVLFGVPAP